MYGQTQVPNVAGQRHVQQTCTDPSGPPSQPLPRQLQLPVQWQFFWSLAAAHLQGLVPQNVSGHGHVSAVGLRQRVEGLLLPFLCVQADVDPLRAQALSQAQSVSRIWSFNTG